MLSSSLDLSISGRLVYAITVSIAAGRSRDDEPAARRRFELSARKSAESERLEEERQKGERQERRKMDAVDFYLHTKEHRPGEPE